MKSPRASIPLSTEDYDSARPSAVPLDLFSNKGYEETITEEKKVTAKKEKHIVRYSSKSKNGNLTYELKTKTIKDNSGDIKEKVGAGIEVTWDD